MMYRSQEHGNDADSPIQEKVRFLDFKLAHIWLMFELIIHKVRSTKADRWWTAVAKATTPMHSFASSPSQFPPKIFL